MTPTRIQEISQRFQDLRAMRDRAEACIPGASEQALTAMRFIIEDIESAWDTRDTALRSLVQQWRSMAERADAADCLDPYGRVRKRAQAYYLNACAEELARLLTSEDH